MIFIHIVCARKLSLYSNERHLISSNLTQHVSTDLWQVRHVILVDDEDAQPLHSIKGGDASDDR